jgi:predicted dithiol-disulfide oxidoreductase (DUF899 family)
LIEVKIRSNEQPKEIPGNYLDLVPKGRDEDGLDSMSWVRHHDRYDDGQPG